MICLQTPTALWLDGEIISLIYWITWV